MRPIRVFFYIDTVAMVSHCVAAAELIRKELGAHIIMMVSDSEKHFAETMNNYEVYDHRNLYPRKVRSPINEPNGKKRDRRSWFGFRRIVSRHRRRELRYKARIRSARSRGAPVKGLSKLRLAFAASKDVCYQIAQPRAVQKVLLPFVFMLISIIMMPDMIVAHTIWLLRGGRNHLRAKFVGQHGQLFEQLSRLLVSLGCIARFLRVIKPDLIILAEYNVETLSTIFVAKGRAQGIPTIIVPFTIPNPLEPAQFYRDNALYQAKGMLARLLISYYPKWSFEYEGKNLLRAPALKALVLEMLGLSSPAPWILNRAEAVWIALDSEAQRTLYLDLGFPSKQLKVIGDVNSKVLHEGLQNRSRLTEELFAKQGLQPGRPLILCGFPPDQYQGTEISNFEFPNYDLLIEAWIESFKSLGTRANVLVRPHPRIPINRLAGLASSNVKFTWQPTAELIPLSDLYVASISATIRWAISCGVPVINYDTYRYRYSDFDAAPGVIYVETVADFRVMLARFVDDHAFAAEVAERQQSVMKYWGLLDDKSAKRLAELVLSVVCRGGSD
jgi:hypothetical protein